MDKNLETIINRVAARNAVSHIKARLATEIMFRNVKQLMQRDDMPTIMLHGLGRWTRDEKKIKRKLSYLFKVRKEKLTEEEYNNEYKRLTGLLSEIESSKHIRTK